MRILIIDNYDSFTYNLVQLLGMKRKVKTVVKRNDEISLDEITQLNPDKILISPGPGIPENSKISMRVLEVLGNSKSILGVCLGHQAIAVCFGAKVIKSPSPVHGKTSRIIHDNKGVFKKIPQNFLAMRYHSLIVDKDSLPEDLFVTALSEDNTIMALRHKVYPIEGIQFHPESILTEYGYELLMNWVEL